MSASFKSWYQRNKDKINSARAARYKSNPVYRGKILDSQRKHREEHPQASRRGSSRMKVVNEVLQETFRISEVAAMVDRSVQTIRLWHSFGWLPSPSVNSIHRFYTSHQISLMKELAVVIENTRHESREVHQAAVEVKVQEIKARWAL